MCTFWVWCIHGVEIHEDIVLLRGSHCSEKVGYLVNDIVSNCKKVVFRTLTNVKPKQNLWETPIVEETQSCSNIDVVEPSTSLNDTVASGSTAEGHKKRILHEKAQKKSKTKKNDELEKCITDAFHTLENVLKNTPEEDEDDLFCKSIALSVKNIKNKKKGPKQRLPFWRFSRSTLIVTDNMLIISFFILKKLLFVLLY